MNITGEAMINLAIASGAPKDSRAEGVVRWATDQIKALKKSETRLRDLCTEWANAADAACGGDHRPEVLKARLAVLTEQAGRTADQLGEIEKLRDALRNLLDFVDSRTPEDDTEPHLAVDEARELLE